MIRERIARILTRVQDVVFHGRNKAMILIGTDRENEIDSGYGVGGDDDPNSAVIDMVVGFEPEQRNPNYIEDRSRIYIAEKTDPDSYFGIEAGEEQEETPAIVQVSDNVYLKARRNIKIVNGNVSILVKSDGTIEINAENKADINVGTAKITLESNGNISIDGGQGIEGKVITDLDTPIHIDPITGATISANFQGPPATPTRNQKVVIK